MVLPDFSHFRVYQNQQLLASTHSPAYIDTDLDAHQTCDYQLQAIDVHANGGELCAKVSVMITSVTRTDESQPDTYQLFPSYPNPLNSATEIKYTLPETRKVKLTIYNIYGREIRTLVDMENAAGTYRLSWNGTDKDNKPVSSGIYLINFEAGNFFAQRKTSLIR